MKQFFLHDASGRIVQAGRCADADFDVQARPGLTLREGVADPFTQYFDGAAPAAIPAQPSPVHVFDYATKAWIDPRTLAQVKADKWEAMKKLRQAAIDAPLVTPYGTFDADDAARTNIAQTAQFAQTQAQSLAPGATPLVEFTLANNTSVTITAQQMIQVALLLASQVQTAYARGRTVRAAIEAATTAAGVQAITWSTP